MSHSVRYLICTLTLVLGMTGVSIAQTPVDRVVRALDDLNSYVGSGSNGDGWRDYLRTADLNAQIELADRADPQIIAAVITQYRGGANGLQERRFQSVLTALEDWQAELLMPSREELAEFARSSSEPFRARNEADVQAAADAVKIAQAKLTRLVGRGSNGDAWRTYLNLPAIDAQLAADQPELDQLEATIEQLSGDVKGLELPAFIGLRESLRKYIDTYQLANNPEVKTAYEAQLKVLSEALETYADEPNRETAQQIAGRIGWFERMDQAPTLVKAVRQYHSHPNFFGYASEGLLKAAMERAINNTTDISDNFQGTRIVGTGYTTGNTVIEFVPNDSKVAFDILFYGRTISNTRGYNGPVTVSTTGNTGLSARKRILIDENGLSDLRATAAAVTSTHTDGVNSGGGLLSGAIQREAWSRINSSRSAAEAHGSERAKQKIRQRVDQQTQEFLGKANANFQAKFKAPLIRRQAFPRLLAMSTTDDLIRVKALQANDFQIAAPGEPPEVEEVGDLGVRVHSSLINNAAAVFYSGRTITEAESNEFMLKAFGEIPEELKTPEDAEPWSITFARQNPIFVSFDDDNRVTFTLSGRKYTSGERSFGAMDVKATYEFVLDDGGLLLRRDGDIRIEPPGFDPETSKLSTSQVTLRTLLKKRFEKALKPEIEVAPFDLPGEFTKAGKIGFDSAGTSGDWLVMQMSRLNSGTPRQVQTQASLETTNR